MKQRLLIFGAGGYAREVLWIAREINLVRESFEILGFIDDDSSLHGKVLAGARVLGGFDWLEENFSNELRGIIGIGNTGVRKTVHLKAQKLGLQFTNLIHPSVQFSKYVELGVGVVLAAGNILTTQIQLHDHVSLNLACTTGHDTTLEAYVNCAPGCNISGSVHLKTGAHLGTGVKVIQQRTIGEWTTVGAGAVVIQDIPAHCVAVGVPAKVIKSKEPAK